MWLIWLVWRTRRSGFTMTIVGLILLATSLFQFTSLNEVSCGNDEMTPGDVCTTSYGSDGDRSTTETYDEVAADNRWKPLIGTGAGVLGLAGVYFGVRAAHRQGTLWRRRSRAPTIVTDGLAGSDYAAHVARMAASPPPTRTPPPPPPSSPALHHDL